VRVTDFGLVSALAANEGAPPSPLEPPAIELSISGTPLSQDLTRTGAIMGTPHYMAPEQFSGRETTTRTDQFAFCVALYEAVYGERPFSGATYQELMTCVLLGKVSPTPATARVPGWLRRALLRGLSLDPDQRYPSMGDLLSALARDTMRRRRRILVWCGAAACLATAALVFAGHADHGSECRAGDARVGVVWNPSRRAAMRAAFDGSGRPHAATSFAKATGMLDAWRRSWETGYVDACEATRVRGEQSEHLLDLRMQCLARRLDDARATIDLVVTGGGDAVDHALDALIALPSIAPCADPAALLADVAPPESAISGSVAAVRAQLDEARAQRRLGRYPKALEIARPALHAARTLAYLPAVTEALILVGVLQQDVADPATITTLREAMHIAAEAGDAQNLVDAASSLVYAITVNSTNYEVAHEIAELAEATARHARPPVEVRVRLDNSIGLLLATQGHPAEAQARYETALALAEKELGPDAPAVLTTLNQLGNVEKTRGRFAEARKALERVLATRERLVGKDHPDLASSLNNLANVYRAEGKLDDAKRLYDRALAIRIAALGPNHPDVAGSLNNLGMFYADQEDHVAAQDRFEQALAIWEKTYGPNSIEVAGALLNLGSELSARGDYAGAQARGERALAIYEAAYGAEHPSVATVLSNLGVVAQNQDKLDEALAQFQRAERIAEKAFGPDHPDVADYLGNIATVLKQQHKLAEAEAVSSHALRVIEKAYGPTHSRMGLGLSNFGNLLEEKQDHVGALDAYRKSLAIFEATLNKSHPYLSYPLLGIGTSLLKLKRAAEGVPFLERALAIRGAAAMQPDDVAEARFALAEALVTNPRDQARALAEATTALAEFEKATDPEGATEVRAWIRAHRRSRF
jgi:tetratricopeptide (TPR) repeat protein